MSTDRFNVDRACPQLTPAIAEAALTAATDHGLTVRIVSAASPVDCVSRKHLRRLVPADELTHSMAVYILALTWWAYPDSLSRSRLMGRAEVVLGKNLSNDKPLAEIEGYLSCMDAMHAAVVAPDNIDEALAMVERFDVGDFHRLDAIARAVMLAEPERFGAPAVCAEQMRNTMTTLAYYP